VNGKMSGKATIQYRDGKYYKGDFLDGMKHGYGFFYWNDENTY
jgi:hypothetical protein